MCPHDSDALAEMERRNKCSVTDDHLCRNVLNLNMHDKVIGQTHKMPYCVKFYLSQIVLKTFYARQKTKL